MSLSRVVQVTSTAAYRFTLGAQFALLAPATLIPVAICFAVNELAPSRVRGQLGTPSPPSWCTSMKSASSFFPLSVTEDENDVVTIIGFGSLLSEKSSRLTFPNLQRFRRGRVHNFRRVFGHPTSIFFRRGIANMDTKEMSSLAVEPADGYGFVASIFEVSKADFLEGSQPGLAFLEREEEFDIVQVPFDDLESSDGDSRSVTKGIICTRSTDEEYIRKWGQERFDDHYRKYGIETIWKWQPDSGLRPCAIYLRHCILASRTLGQECYDSFLDDTYLVDRRTTIRAYLEMYPHILDLQPPADLVDRYSG